MSKLPRALHHVWKWFWEVYDFRAGGPGNPAYLTYQEINAFNECYDLNMSHWEKSLLRQISVRFVRSVEKKRKTEQDKTASIPPGVTNLRPMTDSAGIRSIFANKGMTAPIRKPGNG